MVFFSLLRRYIGGPPTIPHHPMRVHWQRTPKGRFYRLVAADVNALRGQSGVYVIWHRGIEPRWLYIGATADLGHALDEARENVEITRHESRGGICVTWLLLAESQRKGAARYLKQLLQPELPAPLPGDDSVERARIVPVQPPG